MRRTGYLLAGLLLTVAASLWVAASLIGRENIEARLAKILLDHERERAELTTSVIRVDDITWSVLQNEWQPGRQTVVLLHGFAADSSHWSRFVAQLGAGYNLLIPDLPGHGDTTRDSALAYDIDAQTRRLLALMTALGVETFHLAGSSMGGGIAARAAWLAPQRVQSLGLFNAAGAPAKATEFTVEVQQGNNPLLVRQPGDLDRVLAWTMAEPPVLPWPIKPVLERRQIARAALYEKIFADLVHANGMDQTAILPQISTRALVLWGDQDRLLDVADAERFATLLPNATKTVMADIGHLPMLEDPQQSAAIYREFLAAE